MSGEGGVGYIAMTAEVLEELDLAQGSLGENLLAENIGDFLDGNAFAGLGIGCGTGREDVGQFICSITHKPGYHIQQSTTW